MTADSTGAATGPTTAGSAGDAPLLEVAGLKKHFRQSAGFVDRLLGSVGTIRAVDGVDLTVRRGETLAVVGESGCGKSTLGRTILNLETATAGTVSFRGTDLTSLSASAMKRHRADMQMIFQDPLKSLNPRQSVRQILTAPMEVHGIGESAADRVERAEALLERVDLKREHINRYPHQLSGGQQQRVALARALTLDPEFLVADEPVSGLDVSIQAKILNLIDELQDDFGLTVLLISHDLRVVRHIADRVCVMYLGEIVERGPVDALFADPQHPYTRSLLSSIPRMERDGDRERVLLEGTVPSASDPPAGCRFHTRCPEVIPPEDWPADQPAFRRAFTFRHRILSEEFDLELMRSRLDAEGEGTDDATLADHIVDQTLPGERGVFHDEAAEAVDAAAAALAAGDRERAVDIVTEAFPTPCERTAPETTAVGDGQAANCHRLDPEQPGAREVT